MKNRSRIEIMGQILEAANGCSSMSQIMYKTFLSHTQIKGYLKTLIDNGFLSYDFNSQTYKITKKGMRLLQLYNQIDEMIHLSQQQQQQQQRQPEEQQQAWI
jgi:predicted transcriptional regulator